MNVGARDENAVSRVYSGLHVRHLLEVRPALEVYISGPDAGEASRVVGLVHAWPLVDQVEIRAVFWSEETPFLDALVEAVHLIIGVFMNLAVGVAVGDPKVCFNESVTDRTTSHAWNDGGFIVHAAWDLSHRITTLYPFGVKILHQVHARHTLTSHTTFIFGLHANLCIDQISLLTTQMFNIK